MFIWLLLLVYTFSVFTVSRVVFLCVLFVLPLRVVLCSFACFCCCSCCAVLRCLIFVGFFHVVKCAVPARRFLPRTQFASVVVETTRNSSESVRTCQSELSKYKTYSTVRDIREGQPPYGGVADLWRTSRCDENKHYYPDSRRRLLAVCPCRLVTCARHYPPLTGVWPTYKCDEKEYYYLDSRRRLLSPYVRVDW